VVLAAWIECASALRALASALHIFGDSQDVFALPTKHRALVSLRVWPDSRLMRLESIMATDARVELLAAEMLNRDDVKRRVPVRALG
jgi:hypothetical protein